MAEEDSTCSEVSNSSVETTEAPDQLQISHDFILDLQSQLKHLRIRVKELELENTTLSKISSCCCGKNHVEGESPQVIEDKQLLTNFTANFDQTSQRKVRNGYKSTHYTKKKSGDAKSGCYLETMYHHAKRYVALKIMYFGQRFYGFASEAQMDPTVESEIFKALEKTKLLVGEKYQYSRCGRTDKGVSAVGQVIALYLRSKLKNVEEHLKCEEVTLNELCEKEEIDYVKVLNRVLPNDIRVIGWCPAPRDFHARFSCLSREYKYLFWRENLDITAMETAGKKFVGEHDFRNFCKMDALNVHNYRRQITAFEITSCSKWFAGDEVWAVRIKGSAFLWHQVRCMVAVLFMIGQGLESPSVIDVLLDTNGTSRKPQYTMAPELPLVLQSCEFEGLNFICSSDAGQALHEHLKKEFQSYLIQAIIFHGAFDNLPISGASPLQAGKRISAHVPLMSRPTEPSYKERRAKLNEKFKCKSPLTSGQKQLRDIMNESDSVIIEKNKSNSAIVEQSSV